MTPTAEASYSRSNEFRRFHDAVPSGTGSVASRTETAHEDRRQENREKWRKWIDNVLIDWGRNPDQLADDDIDPPHRSTIARAIQIAWQLQRADIEAPDRVSVDVNGVIAFEKVGSGSIASTRIRPDGTIQIVVFRDNELLLSKTLPDAN